QIIWPVPKTCKQLESCERCLEGDPSQNITGCIWMHCGATEEGCIGKGEPIKKTCSISNDTAAYPSNTTASPHLPGTTTSPPQTATPGFRPPGFDSASFIGGIVLVLSVQAVFYFIVKFLKSKDSTYQTL
uniref:CD164 molecule like 2 n=1 Tax=Pelusios castaneus TaxID=367368 RepID=A0A8C8R6I7_9SAUR